MLPLRDSPPYSANETDNDTVAVVVVVGVVLDEGRTIRRSESGDGATENDIVVDNVAEELAEGRSGLGDLGGARAVPCVS